MKEFPENQILSEHVKIIKECLENNPKKKYIANLLNTKFIVYKDEIGDNKNIYSFLNDNNTILASEYERYNNQYPFEKRLRH